MLLIILIKEEVLITFIRLYFWAVKVRHQPWDSTKLWLRNPRDLLVNVSFFNLDGDMDNITKFYLLQEAFWRKFRLFYFLSMRVYHLEFKDKNACWHVVRERKLVVKLKLFIFR